MTIPIEPLIDMLLQAVWYACCMHVVCMWYACAVYLMGNLIFWDTQRVGMTTGSVTGTRKTARDLHP